VGDSNDDNNDVFSPFLLRFLCHRHHQQAIVMAAIFFRVLFVAFTLSLSLLLSLPMPHIFPTMIALITIWKAAVPCGWMKVNGDRFLPFSCDLRLVTRREVSCCHRPSSGEDLSSTRERVSSHFSVSSHTGIVTPAAVPTYPSAISILE